MAVTDREHEMLALAEEGYSVQAIALRMGIKVGSVKRTLTSLSWSPAADIAREAAIRQGSQQLLAAIKRARRPVGEQIAPAQPGFPDRLIDRAAAPRMQ